MKYIAKVMALVAFVFVAALATADVSADPYTGQNVIGNYQQYQYQTQWNTGWNGGYHYSTGPVNGGQLTLPNPYYSYPTQPRLGGSFGSWYMAGLRTPAHYCVTPTHYSNIYRSGCSSSSYGPGPGTSGSYNNVAPVRVRYGGGFV